MISRRTKEKQTPPSRRRQTPTPRSRSACLDHDALRRVDGLGQLVGEAVVLGLVGDEEALVGGALDVLHLELACGGLRGGGEKRQGPVKRASCVRGPPPGIKGALGSVEWANAAKRRISGLRKRGAPSGG